MNDEYVIDSCISISPKEVLKILKGITITRMDIRQLNLNCWLNDPNEPDFLCMSIGGREPQTLELEWLTFKYGDVAFFNCGAGHRVRKLYLVPQGNAFECRLCGKFRYFASRLNPKSEMGQAVHRFENMRKLVYARVGMSKISHKGKYTKRFNRWLERCSKAGLHDVVENAKTLLEIGKTQ